MSFKKIENKFLLLGIVLLIVCSNQSWAIKIGYVDSRICTLSHPVFQNFDWKTRRFFGTISAPIKSYEHEFKMLEEFKEETTFKLKKMNAHIGKSFQTKGKNDNELWKKRTLLTEKLEYVKQRKELLQELQKTGLLIPKPESTSYTLFKVEDDLKIVFKELKKTHGIDLLVDRAALSPVKAPAKPRMDILGKNQLNSYFKDPKKMNVDDFIMWLGNSRNYWHRKLPVKCNNPFKFGAIDYTDSVCTSIKKMPKPEIHYWEN